MTFAKIKFSAQILFRDQASILVEAMLLQPLVQSIRLLLKILLLTYPIIPGSSLKGKMRTLLAKVYNEKVAEKPSDDSDILSRLFGNSKDKRFKMGRLIFRDAFLSNADELDSLGVRSYTEVKFENTIDRITAEANPRQIERAIRNSTFDFELIYEITDEE